MSPRKTLIGSFAVPFGRLPKIGGDTRATGIDLAQLQLGFGIPFFCTRFNLLKCGALGIGLLAYAAKLLVLSGAVVVVETTNAKLRLFRVPDLLSAAFVLAALALLSTFLFQ